ncbi:MAG: hypothetical protein FAZ92_03730 [Accumulibacter sp.]|uniref:hypothetical protein n=1 Tax=Accumulibacter sp. TaxID=2053492 RepID=UPI0011F9EEC8|nr:hypothetical protein [Accumulibacter sp.]TLD44021.1 MAG: hypothetical protein FAZ92_03730 [Accumulibacter sp.]
MPVLFLRKPSILFILLALSAAAAAQGKKHYRDPDDIDLPPPQQRKVIGIWTTSSLSGTCTRSFEGVKERVFQVIRCDDGSGGKTGQLLAQVSTNKFLPRGNAHGAHYVILPNGDLSVRDGDGEIDVEPKHQGFWPTARTTVAQSPKAEHSKTTGLKCQEIGYRYGFTATSSMKGKKTDPAWDFAVPGRCQNDPETTKGIQAGTRAAW